MPNSRVPVWKARHSLIWKLLLLPVPYSRGGAIFQIAFFALVYWWFRAIPPPGFAAAALVIAAFIMAVRAQRFTRIEEVAWILIACALFGVEIQAITKDRTEFAQKEDARTREENTKFKNIADGLTASMRQGQAELDAMKQQQQLSLEIRSKLSESSYDALVRRNQKIKSDLANVSRDFSGWMVTHDSATTSIRDQDAVILQNAKTQQDKNAILARENQKKQTLNEQFERQYREKLEPQLVKILGELLTALGKDESKASVIADYGLNDPYAAQYHMQGIKAIAQQLVP